MFSHPPTLTYIKTTPTSDVVWRSLKRILFISHPLLWASFIHVFTCLLYGGWWGGEVEGGALSQNSDFIKYLLGLRSLLSKY